MTQRSTHILAFLVYMVAGSISMAAQVASPPYENTAVDVKGVRHTARQYKDHRPPWNFSDCIKAVGAEYPYADRQRYHQGSGPLRITIDPNTGAAAHVTVLQSTGYHTLDNSVLVALGRWRWKPGTWKEVNAPITFQMVSKPPTRLHPGATLLPRS